MAEDKELLPFEPMLMGIVGLVVVMGMFDFIAKLGIPSITPDIPEEGEIVLPGEKAIVYGFVTDALTGLPMKDVQVTLDSLLRYTASEGQYEVRDLVAGRTYVMVFSKVGYKAITVKVKPIADLNEVNVAMEYAV